MLVGLEEYGLEEFAKAGYWSGMHGDLDDAEADANLFVDKDKAAYQVLGLARAGWSNGFGLLDSRVHTANKNLPEHIHGNSRGDGMQFGATFVFAKGGDLMMDHRQEYYGHYPEEGTILAAVAKAKEVEEAQKHPVRSKTSSKL